MTNLAKIERVDVRQIWPNEAQVVTQWQAENMSELGSGRLFTYAAGYDTNETATWFSTRGYPLVWEGYAVSRVPFALVSIGLSC